MKNKLKTNRAAKKRFKITGTGKIKRYKSNQRHLLGHESSKTKRNRRGTFDLAKADETRIKRMLPGVA